MQAGLDLVFIHGLFSGPSTWNSLASLVAADDSLSEVKVNRFAYASPKLQLRPDRRIPAIEDIADLLKTFLDDQTTSGSRLLLVAHSQGGLVVQRYLARMLSEGRGRELARITGVVLFACPNTGSEFALSLRKAWWQLHPQERTLRPFNDLIADTHRTVQNQIVKAGEIGPSTCPIQFWAYGGVQDNVVKRASAQSTFIEVSMLPGDHSSIIQPSTPEDPVYRVLRARIAEAQGHERLAGGPARMGRILQNSPMRKQSPRLAARLEGYGSRHRLTVSNTGTVDIRNVSVVAPAEASSFRLMDRDLPVDVLRPGETIRLPVAVVMGGGKSIFDIEMTGLLENGESVQFFSKISI